MPLPPPPGGLDKRRLPWQQPVQARGLERYVYSFSELVNAIGDYVGSSSSTENGKCIVIARTFPLEQSITIPATASGITLRALHGANLTTDNGQYIACYALPCSFYDITIQAQTASSSGGIYCYPSATKGEPKNLITIVGCRFDKIISVAVAIDRQSGDPDFIHGIIDKCVFSGGDNAVNPAEISVDVDCSITNCTYSSSTYDSLSIVVSSRCHIAGNRISGGTVIGEIVVTGTGGCTIVGNMSASSATGAITTTGSSGYNTIVGNTRFTVGAHASDATSANLA